ncbi:hypothetical protein AMS68_004791 [Peltaster fructicola]|uniref:Phytoene desaturase n=1 Tax=Peltaster fructicola TaxID=286661 RepID=A0A6H0XX16_9PEZI|nr:hypothetical protein AMS68_004791 [Peltaster fructicola]
MSEKKPTAIVIGAGAGGVSVAARLAKAGFEVTVVEKNDFSGGRCSLIHHEGYRFDQGPSLLLLPHLFKRTFNDLGTSLEAEGVHLLKCEPNYDIFFGDGEKMQLSTDLAVMKQEVERFEGTGGFERYLQFMAESYRHYDLSVTHVLLKNFESLFSMLRPGFIAQILALHPFESIWRRASLYFHTERLRRVFTFGSMYMGMSPFDAPGTYSLLQATEAIEGIWYPVGGFNKVIEALVNIGERFGVKYRFNTPVESIILNEDGSSAQGVRLSNGEVLKADIVINNSDLVYAYNELLPRSGYSESLLKRDGSCSSISFYWALSKKVPELQPHNIFLADEYKESFDSIFKEHLIPSVPSFYVNVPSRVDPTAAPEGADSVVVLVPVGHLVGEAAKHPSAKNDPPANSKPTAASSSLKAASPAGQTGILPTADQDWPAMIALARKTILATIKARTGADLSSLILHEITNDPTTWQARFNLDKGAILGLSHSFFNVLSFRPTTRARRAHWLDGKLGGGVVERILLTVVDATRGRSKDIQGLYMVGASVHPGTGVPICIAGASIVADQILDDLKKPAPWTTERNIDAIERRGDGVTPTKQLDLVDSPKWLSDASWIVLIACSALVWALWSRL